MADLSMEDLQNLLNQNSSSQVSPDDLNSLLGINPESQQSDLARNINQLSAKSSIPTSNSPINALPYGGLTQAQLQDYLAKNPGPVAEIGFNPSATKAEAPDEEDQDESVPAAPVSRKPIAKPVQPSALTQSPVSAQALGQKDYLGNLLGNISVGTDQLKAAQQQQADMMRAAGMAAAGKEIAAAMSRGGYKPNYTANQTMMAQAQLPVQNIMQQQAVMKDSIDQGLKASDLLDKEQARDPQSTVSQAYRGLASQLSPALAKDPNFQNLDAEGVKQLLPGIDMQVKMSYYTAMKNAMASQRQDQMEQRQQYQNEQKQNMAESRLGQALTTSYSMRGANGQSQRNEQLADRIMDLAKSYNPNDPQSAQNARLVLNETMGLLAQAANGGIATETGVERIYPNTLTSKLAGLQTYLTNNPTGYDVKPFLDQAVQQAKIFKSISQNYQKRNNGALLYGYKNSVRPETYEHYKNQLGLSDDDVENFFNRTSDTSSTAGQALAFSPSQEAGINAFMKGNNISDRNQAIQILKQAGKL